MARMTMLSNSARSPAEGVGDHVDVVDARQHDDRQTGMIEADLVEQCEAVGA
jgi:hypothetical protein